MKRKLKVVSTCLTLLALMANVPARADDSQLISMVEDMKQEMKKMSNTISQQNDKISRLERRNSETPAAAPAVSSGANDAAAPMSDYEFNQRLETALGGANKWLKDMKQGGDLRLRYEAFSYKSGNPAETDDRNRFRYRLRYGIEKKFNEDMNIGFGVASGETGATGSNGLNTDPTSTNTTFDNLFNFKPIFIEKAYAQYTPGFLKNRGILKKTEITAGKVNNPFEKGSSDMIWDRDVKPEGIYEKFDFSLIDTDNFDLNAYSTTGQFVLDEDATVSGDANLFAFQWGINPIVYIEGMDRPVDILSAVSFYNYSNYARRSNFLIGSTSLARGNVNSDNITTELDSGAFKVIESYNEVAIFPMGVPTRFSFDIAGNPSDAAGELGDQGNTVINEALAYGFGVKLGGLVKKGDWEISYAYKRIGANAVVGAFNDSDFGDGHSGKRGSVFKAGYAITDNISLNGAMYLVNNLNSGTSGIVDIEQRRFQMDMSWKF